MSSATTQPKTDTSADNGKTVTFTANEVTLLRIILDFAMQRELSEAGRSANPREAVKKVQNIITLDDLLK